MTKPLVPAYIWSGDNATWERVVNSLPPGIAIVNPNNGPGGVKDPVLSLRVNDLVARGWEVVGYVATGYLTRSISDIARDVTMWRFWYPKARGVFFDEIPNSGAQTLEALMALQSMGKRLGGSCIFNPGAPVPPRYLSVVKNSIFVTFEDTYANYRWEGAATPTDREAHLVYGVPAGVNLNIAAPYGFATTDVLPNPWDGV